jgi:hypothetical protein
MTVRVRQGGQIMLHLALTAFQSLNRWDLT